VMKMPLIPISWGELLDKITILEIKVSKLKEERASNNVAKELSLLIRATREVLPERDNRLCSLVRELSEINLELWDIENMVREKENQKVFDDEFISLARSVYKTNDRRARVKRQINILLDSELSEEKSFI
jgi:hypothetical protein